ncbi:hypothetical protein CD175_09320 [Pseudomonas laurylsulfatiphila]|uniref:Uncharacterized protein n=1 Tax=Pseudomonas laurylsulfatiphila TaxID=2011015 RepID=A0A2S6FQB7_9PSED|nr:hypothetical protein CD175_09320 [Pseudomonas laurylsulfatiphila]
MQCGSEPARESGVSVAILGDCQAVFASRLAPTGFTVRLAYLTSRPASGKRHPQPRSRGCHG